MSSIRRHIDRMERGKKDRGLVPLGHMASGQQVGIPYLICRGQESGPCLWVNGAVHGDEINGTLAAIEFLQNLPAERLNGMVVVTPVSNPFGLDARRKRVPQDELDLDQTFPGRHEGLTSERLAARLFEEVEALADFLVNFHTLGTPFDAKPYGVYKVHPNGIVSEEQLLSLLEPFRPAVACRMQVTPGSGELAGNIPGALDYQCLELGKPAFMVELGAGGRAQEAHIQQGITGLNGLAAKIGLLAPESPPSTSLLRRVTRRTHLTCREGGFFRALASPGDRVPAGEVLGTICSVYGEVVERVTAPQDVIIIGIRRDPVVHVGDRVAFLALEWDDVHIV